MKTVHLASIDLNLLVVFDALVAEGHATRAAERIGLTQPAVSHALNRLRALFGDPLFVRSPRGMVATPLAQDIAPGVRSILEQVEGILLGGRTFDPASSTRQFTLGLSDYAAFVLLPRLTARLDREAPGVSLVVRNTSRSVGLPMLEDGGAELIAGNFPDPPTHMREELLYEEDFICAGRGDHSGLDGMVDLDRYLSLRHLQVSMKGNPRGYVDAVLAEKGLKRNVAVTVGHFLMAPMLVDASDLVATEPRRLFAPLAGRLPLRLFPPPLDIPTFRVVQTWHARHDADPGHQWLRRVLREVGQWA
ncbi:MULTISPECIES: LysR family transcriptional regulator [Alphaproteobacteria]|jgi:DNA-binding transcriptional LysR family regulator|uniref:DNA-binding transcriptional LysR family regulator n=3 Tax=Alphaproteobacteria TaxID=28211 RepID=A0A7W5Z6P8_9HYPH|nr:MULTISPECIES: LysR family transcriptional regulator [Alphaproteobacteria]MBS48859.1 LysR family transcriptional regulator [Sphingobium sp.]AHE54108.1 LysR family transcriptional regulator [Sphingomonas sanxanigenens DSM 19645 = NX02]MBB3810989.1 DNA-binding transcriptional LysR family regulator [Pseudochelatococcus contaminans]MCC4257983.1 LysR family transcriptional regulator [Sphingobium lactosutens]SOC37377.1 LysR family transcriptional regulator [Rhizobium subbaraonis]|tara:strand:+ start:11734 stop:12648 length:915 start_codon:yes stop_codon:yes gene_type:complete